MRKRYRNVTERTFAGLAPGEEGELSMPEAQAERHVRRGRLREVEADDAAADAGETADNDDPDAAAPDDNEAPAVRQVPKPGGMSHG